MPVALYWWHMELDLSRRAAVDRAYAATSSALRGGKIDRNDSSVTFRSSSLITTVACLPGKRKETQVIVIAAGENGDTTLGVMEELRDGVKRGGPFD